VLLEKGENTMKAKTEQMKQQRFGIEIEMTGITRRRAAEIIAEHFGTTAYGEAARDQQGRNWKLEYDGSISRSGSQETSCELVSPICTYEDIKDIQEIVRKLHKAGARTNDSCGIHIHIDGAPHNAGTLRNICNIMVSKEDLITKSLQIGAHRQNNYCKKADGSFIERINRRHTRTKENFMHQWYQGSNDNRHARYHQSRYRMLNLHSMTDKGTVEFRMFNGTMHAGKIRAYIMLCLAISHQALNQRYATPKKTETTNEKYTFRTWLLRLGMIGKEFANVRDHLLENLDGDIAFKNGRPAAAPVTA